MEVAVVPKYRVFAGGRVTPLGKPLEDGSYFVLRDTDLLAPAVLWGYVAEIQTVLELDRVRHFLTDEERRYLDALEQEVHSRAEEWMRRGKGRLPD